MLAHLSDPHLNPLPRLRATDLMGKRATGYVNWLRSRRFVHDMELLDRIVADMLAQQPDHVACTGDVTHIGLPGEFPTAIRFLGAAIPAAPVPGRLHPSIEAPTAHPTRQSSQWLSRPGIRFQTVSSPWGPDTLTPDSEVRCSASSLCLWGGA
jgi:3',5'-cyclic AMP phosphodiesterase CpdA